MAQLLAGQRPSLTIANRVFTVFTGLIRVHGVCGSNSNATFRKSASSSGYTPSGSTAFRLWAVKTICRTAAGVLPKIAYSDNDVGQDSASSLTNPVYVGGNSAMDWPAGSAIGSASEYDCDFLVANTKYLSFNSGANTRMMGWGYEE